MGYDVDKVSQREELDAVIRACRVCRLGMADKDVPYVVPMSFGYDGSFIFFHCALEGRKLDVLRRNPRVCVEFDILDAMIESDRGCGWGMRYRSVLVFGTAAIVEDTREKIRGLDVLLAQYSPGKYTYPPKMLERTAVVRVAVESMTGRKRR